MKVLQVTMGDGSVWQVPANLAAEQRATYYAKADSGVSEGEEFDTAYIDEFESQTAEDIIDWAHNNMNWDDVSGDAVIVKPPPAPDLQDGWINGDMQLIETDASG